LGAEQVFTTGLVLQEVLQSFAGLKSRDPCHGNRWAVFDMLLIGGYLTTGQDACRLSSLWVAIAIAINLDDRDVICQFK
jgi:hypothetical protein